MVEQSRRGCSLRARSRRRVWLTVACLALGAAGASGRQADWRATGLASFDEVWRTVDDTYYDPSFGDLDWIALREEYRPRVVAAGSPETIREVIQEMLARLGSSHFELIAPGGVRGQGHAATVPIEVRIVDAALVVTEVASQTSGPQPDLRPGDRIVAVDNEDVQGWMELADGRDERERRLAVWQRAVRALRGPAGTWIRLVVLDASGRTREVEVGRTIESGEVVSLGHFPPLRVRGSAREIATPAGRRVGVLAFNFWMPALSGTIDAAVDTYRNADGFVVDLRGNPGGLIDMVRGVAGHFLAGPELLGRVHMRDAVLMYWANPRRSTADGRRVEPFAGPLAVLVDELTASASECFAGALQDLGRARVFGTVTMGQALPASTRRLSNGDVLVHAVGDFAVPSGSRLEGAGVVPDVHVPLQLDAVAAGRDAALEAALAWIEDQSASGV